MKHLLFMLIIYHLFTKAKTENDLVPREHPSTIDPSPSRAATEKILSLIKRWTETAAYGTDRERTIFDSTRSNPFHLDMQGAEPYDLNGQRVYLERYAIQGRPNTYAVVHIQRDVRFGSEFIREAFRQSLETQSHVFLTNGQFPPIREPYDEHEGYYERVPINRIWDRRNVWRVVWGIHKVVEAMRGFHKGPRGGGGGHDGLRKRDKEWTADVTDVMEKCIKNSEDNAEITKQAHYELKENWPEYHIFVGVYKNVRGNDHHAYVWRNKESVHNFDVGGKNYAVFRVDAEKPTTKAETFFENKWDKIFKEYKGIRTDAKKAPDAFSNHPKDHDIDLGNFIDFIDETTNNKYPFIMLVHHGSELKMTYDGGVIIKNEGRETFVIGLDEFNVPGLDAMMEDNSELIKPLTAQEIQERIEKNNPLINFATEPTGISSIPANSCEKRIVGYYTGWGKRAVTEQQLQKLTHIIFAFITMSADGSIKFDGVPEDFKAGENPAEITKKRFLEMKNKARKAKSGVKILVAIGGWSNSQYFSAVAAAVAKRKNFVTNIANFLIENGIDGVDIDWEYPVTGGANEGLASDKKNYVLLVKELRQKLFSLQKDISRKTPYIISLASAAGQWVLDPGYNLKGLLKHVDFINVMTYDYYGAWESKWGAYTGPPAPLHFNGVKGSSGKMNVHWTMKYYTCKTKKPSKLNMGVPFYGRYWNNVGNAIDNSHPMYRIVEKTNGKFDGGSVAYRDIQNSGWNLNSVEFDETVKAPFIWDSGANNFWDLKIKNR